MVIRYKDFKDINNRYFKKQIEHKKGVFENEFTFNTGTHKYINHFTFSQPQPNTIGVIKNVYSENNNSVIWNKPNTNFSFNNTFSSVSQSYNNIINVDFGNVFEEGFYNAGGYGNYNYICDCSLNFVYVPTAIEIIDYNTNGKIPFVWIGIDASEVKWHTEYCSILGDYFYAPYFDLKYYIIASAGTIPTPLFLTHWSEFLKFGNIYYIPTPGNINITYIDWYEYCRLRKQGYPSAKLWVFLYKYETFSYNCDGENINLWKPYYSIIGDNGEYVHIKIYKNLISTICIL